MIKSIFYKILEVANHLSTDVENKNVSEHGRLWKLIEYERKDKDHKFPMFKSVCAVHSSALTFKIFLWGGDRSRCVGEKIIAALSTFFHTSAARTTELEEITEKHSLKARHLPKHYDIRWSEFTSALIDAVLISWRSLIKYCSKSIEEQANDFGKMLNDKENLQLIWILGDVLFY